MVRMSGGLESCWNRYIGNIKGCESLYSDEFIEGNLREESLSEIWYKEDNFAYNRNFDISMLTGSCKGCDKGAICRGGQRGVILQQTQSLKILTVATLENQCDSIN